jgi:hypothetical protein
LLELPTSGRALHVHRFRLPLARLRVEVVDLEYKRLLGDALESADLVVNGGYWGWGRSGQRVLIGLVSAGGHQYAPLRRALDGGVLLLHRETASIRASRGFSGPAAPDLAIQCRPRLLSDGALVANLDSHGRAARTAVCTRDGGRMLEVYLSDPDELGPSLYDLARWLLVQGCEHALNLDGGPSTAAAYREHGRTVRLGPGRELPYALRFRYQAR